jgi:hypothetical protein
VSRAAASAASTPILSLRSVSCWNCVRQSLCSASSLPRRARAVAKLDSVASVRSSSSAAPLEWAASSSCSRATSLSTLLKPLSSLPILDSAALSRLADKAQEIVRVLALGGPGPAREAGKDPLTRRAAAAPAPGGRPAGGSGRTGGWPGPRRRGAQPLQRPSSPSSPRSSRASRGRAWPRPRGSPGRCAWRPSCGPPPSRPASPGRSSCCSSWCRGSP